MLIKISGLNAPPFEVSGGENHTALLSCINKIKFTFAFRKIRIIHARKQLIWTARDRKPWNCINSNHSASKIFIMLLYIVFTRL